MAGFYSILQGDCLDRLRGMPDRSVHCCVTSPPYWNLRNYKVDGQIGLEQSPLEYLAKLVEVFREVRRVLRYDGTCWCNMGDGYANDGKWGGSTGGKHTKGLHGKSSVGREKRETQFKPKELMGMPWRLAFALQEDGWWLRQDIIWSKPNPMPESATDRCTKSHEYVFLLTKAAHYYYDSEAIKEDCVKGDAGSSYTDGKTAVHQLDRAGKQTRKTKVPGGWDTGSGAHGTIHREGRTEAEYVEADVDGKRNKRSVWNISTEAFPEAHFATFPMKLVEPMILAGTSEWGCCPKCLAPWVRQTTRTKRTRSRPNELTKRTGELGTGNHCANTVAGVDVKTTGWLASCKCGIEEVVPATILDPFLGSGTSVAVAVKLGRRGIGIELNGDYCAMAKRKIDAAVNNTMGMFAEAELDLFNEMESAYDT